MPALKFLGASVRSVSSQISWDMGGPSQLNVSLVEDVADGDVFAPGALLRPVYFTMGGFEFNGILQRVYERKEVGGYPTYEVVVVDPREILDGAKVILGGYTGAVTVPNLLNVYGWWENQQFGSSQADETGMYWSKVVTALAAMLGAPGGTSYGGPLNFHGYTYNLDLSQLPVTATHYKLGNNLTMSLLEIVSQVCDDHGCNFFVDLVGTTIRVRTVSRASQPPLGVLSSLSNASRGTTLMRADTGVEGRNEVTSSFLFGGEVKLLHASSGVATYWGNSDQGAPILGTPIRFDLTDQRVTCRVLGGSNASSIVMAIDFTDGGLYTNYWRWAEFNVYTGDVVPFYILTAADEIIKVQSRVRNSNNLFVCQRGAFSTTPANYNQNTNAVLCYYSTASDYMVLNSSSVSDLIGSVTYPCTTFELRLVKGASGLTGWAAFLQHYRPVVAQILGLLPPLMNRQWNGRKVGVDLVNDDVAAANMAAVSSDAWAKVQRFYEWLRSYADDYMGRKFAVSLPFVLHKQNAETLRVGTSYEVDDGGWLEEGATPLGLSVFNQDVFKTQDGRFRAFADYANVLGADFSLVSPANTVLEGNKLYTMVDVDPALIYTPLPAAVVTVPGPLFDSAADWTGDNDILSAVLQLLPEQGQRILKGAAFGSVGYKIAPAHRTPASVAVPLRSNTQTYGPWYVSGRPGKVHVEHDSTLVPWNYGGYALMSAVAQARVVSAATTALIIESGMREEVGLPTAGLGDVLQAGGPNITGIQVTYGDRGFSTSYSFSTFTPFNRAGFYSRTNQERVRRLALTQAQLRKSLRTALKGAAGKALQRLEGARVQKAFLGELPKAVRKQSPHDMLVAQTFYDDLRDKTRTGVASLTAEELVGGVNADEDAAYRRTAGMSLNGLLRPFTTEVGAETMSAYSQPVLSGGIDRATLDPWKAPNDIDFLVCGDSYPGLNVYQRGADTSKARPLALRGPVVVAGWGYSTTGEPVPNSGGEFPANYLYEPHTWKVGPVDLLWDELRAVWSCHDVMKGIVRTAIGSALAGSGQVSIYKDGADTGRYVVAYNWGTSTIPSGEFVHLFLNVIDKKWYASSAQTVASSASAPAAPSSLFSFHTPEFVVNSASVPHEVLANWGSGIQPVALENSPGSGELFARHDHVHAHPVFNSGDHHPEYKLPSGDVNIQHGGYLAIDAGGQYRWTRPAGLVEVGGAVPGTCLHSGVAMYLAESGCCWNSGEAVYFSYLSPEHSGAYVPAFHAGWRGGTPIYSSLGAAVSGVFVCNSGSSGGGGDTVDACGVTGIPTTLTVTVVGGGVGCDCADDAFPVAYNESTGRWEATSPSICGETAAYEFYCEGVQFLLAVNGTPYTGTLVSSDPLYYELISIPSPHCPDIVDIAVTE